MTLRGLALLPVAAVVAVLVGGCGVPRDPAPRAIPPERVPFGLLDDEVVASTTTSAPAGSATVPVFFVEGERLVATSREAPAPATPDGALGALLTGPSAEEAERGLRTAIPPSAGVVATGVDGSRVELELSRSFADTSGPNQILAIAQIVYTVTALPGVDQASFTLEGRSVEVPVGDGTLESGPLGREDFPAVAPA